MLLVGGRRQARRVKRHTDDAYSKSGDNPDLKRWAATTLPHLTEHLTMAEKRNKAPESRDWG
jgi:Domain of unknown function (DUF4142)